MISKDTAYQNITELVERFDEQKESYKKADYNETLTRKDFIDPFFKSLGWDIDNSQGYAEAYREVIHEDRVKIGSATKAPDYSFRLPGGKRLFFVEAKKPSVLVKNEIMPAYQVRRYAWSAKLPVSILTDFEEFAVYDCNKKPKPDDKASTGRIKYLTYSDYLKEFDFIWDTFSKERVLKGSFDKFVASDAGKKGTTTVDKDFLASLDEWRIQLAQNIALRNPAFNEDELNYAVQQTIDRIIFLRIAEDRGVEEYGRLKATLKGDNFYNNLFHLFKEADEKYNSGLFDFKKDKLSASLQLDNKVLKGIFNELYYPVSPYEFSVLSVEILGSAYEQFLGKQIKLTDRHKASIEEKPEVRKAGGVYYTPQYIVDYIVEQTVGKLIEGKKPADVEKIKIVDPACGSGSFLIGAYQGLLTWYGQYYKPKFDELSAIAGSNEYNNKQRNDAIKERNKLPLTPDGALTSALKKQILLNNIYGVDIDTQAVEVTKLSLLLKCMEGETQSSMAAEMRFGERLLPTLDNNIKSGNSLIDLDFYDGEFDFEPGTEKKIKPFSWKKAFPEVFKNGGFDAVIGNPPYIRIQSIIETSPQQADYFTKKYGAAEKGNYDIYVIFIEKALALLRQNGLSGYILPHKFFTAKYGEGIRNILHEKKAVQKIIHFGHNQIFEGATTYTCIVILSKKSANKEFSFANVIDIDKWRATGNIEDHLISYGSLNNEQWNFISDGEQQLFQKLSSVQTKLEHVTERIFQGLKTSADKIFIVELIKETKDQYEIHCSEDNLTYSVEKNLFHTLIKGGDTVGYGFKESNLIILFPYQETNGKIHLISEAKLKTSYPNTYRYLLKHKPFLRKRENGKFDNDSWFAFGRSQALEVISKPKIFTPDISPTAKFAYDDNGRLFFTGGTAGGYGIIVNSDVSYHYLIGLLNSSLLDWYLTKISTQMRGGWYSFEAKYIRHLPIIIPNKEQGRFKDEIEKQVRNILELLEKLKFERLAQQREYLSTRISHCKDVINETILKLYKITDDEKNIIKSNIE